MATTLSADERFDLITRRLQEHLGDDIIKAILAEDGRTPKCYWGPWQACVCERAGLTHAQGPRARAAVRVMRRGAARER
jgi:hypothetical protein